jgi:hypothetical protein
MQPPGSGASTGEAGNKSPLLSATSIRYDRISDPSPPKKKFSECFLSLVRNPISFGLDAIWSGRCWISCLLCEVSNPKFPKLELDTHAQKLFDVAVSCSTLLCAQVVFRAYATRGPYPLYRVCL